MHRRFTVTRWLPCLVADYEQVFVTTPYLKKFNRIDFFGHSPSASVPVSLKRKSLCLRSLRKRVSRLT